MMTWTDVAGQAGFAGPSFDRLATPVTLEEAQFLVKRADMDEASGAAATSLVEAALRALRRDTVRKNRAVERAHTMNPREDREVIQRLIREAVEAHARAHTETSSALLRDMESLIGSDAPQREAWKAFERRRHRRLYLSQSVRVGASVDLVHIAERLKVDDRREVQEVLLPYEVELGRLLLSRHPLALEFEEKFDALVQAGDERGASRLFVSLRDQDCAIISLQRATAKRFLDAVPPELFGEATDLIHRARANMGDQTDRVRARAQRLIDSGRLSTENLVRLREAVRTFDDRSRALTAEYLTETEDSQCRQTFEQSQSRPDFTSARRWLESDRQIRASLLAALDNVATDDDWEFSLEEWERN